MSRFSLLLLVAAPAALLVACGSDTTSGTTSTGAGGSGTTGTGGSGSTTTAAARTGGSASTSAGTTSATGSTSTGMTAMGACTNAADQMIVSSKDVAKITGDCAQSTFGAEPATKDCIKMGTGLSDPCVVCFDDTVGCVVKHCFNQCAADSGSQACTDCRAANCDPAFVTCSGLPSN